MRLTIFFLLLPLTAWGQVMDEAELADRYKKAIKGFYLEGPPPIEDGQARFVMMSRFHERYAIRFAPADQDIVREASQTWTQNESANVLHINNESGRAYDRLIAKAAKLGWDDRKLLANLREYERTFGKRFAEANDQQYKQLRARLSNEGKQELDKCVDDARYDLELAYRDGRKKTSRVDEAAFDVAHPDLAAWYVRQDVNAFIAGDYEPQQQMRLATEADMVEETLPDGQKIMGMPSFVPVEGGDR